MTYEPGASRKSQDELWAVMLGGLAAYEDILNKPLVKKVESGKHSKATFKPSQKQRLHRKSIKRKKQLAAKSRKRNR